MNIRLFRYLALCLAVAAAIMRNLPLTYAASLNIETDYRMRGVTMQTLHYDNLVSTDSYSYYSQRLQLSLKGTFTPDIEIGSKLTAIGVAGSTTTVFPAAGLNDTPPYPNTSFMPFVETAYITVHNFADSPVDITVGRQNIGIGTGLIFDDNGVGYTGLKARTHFSAPFPWETTVFTYKVTDNFKPSTDFDLYGLMGGLTWREHQWELGYFEQRDMSNPVYSKGQLSEVASRIVKTFYDFRFHRDLGVAGYDFEIARQGGSVSKLNGGSQISFDGLGYCAKGYLLGEKTKLGKVKAMASFAYASGDDNLGSLDTNDKAFSPTAGRRWDGLERVGYGELMAATPYDMLIPLPASYSGINTLSMGADFSPLYAWTFGVMYHLYSGSQGPKGAPTASGLERIFGAEFALGIELDLSVAFAYSKYNEIRFSYSRYTPPKFDAFWPKSDPATRMQLEFGAHF